jgi:hypothetical protein
LPYPRIAVSNESFVLRESQQDRLSMFPLRVRWEPTRSLDSGDQTAALPGRRRSLRSISANAPRPANTSAASITRPPPFARFTDESEMRNPYILPTDSGEKPTLGGLA